MSQPNPPSRSEAEAGARKGARDRVGVTWFISIEGICSLVVVEITVLMFAVVVARYVFALPLMWAEETVRYSFTWLAFLSGALAMKHGGHMAMELLAAAMPARFERLIRGTRGVFRPSFSGDADLLRRRNGDNYAWPGF